MKYATLLLLLPVGLALAGVARAGPGATVVLRPAADLQGTRYTLGDIADIESADAAQKGRLAAIPIGEVPRQGYAQSVSRTEVEARVRQEVSLADLEWRGAAQTRIRGRGQRVQAAALFDVAAGALFPVLAGQFDTIVMRPVGGLEGLSVPAGTVSLSARVPARQPVARRMSVLVDVSVDGRAYTTVAVWFSVQASRPALVAREELRPGAALRAQDFAVQTVDLGEGAGPALATDAPLEGMRLRRGLEPGMVLGAAHVQQRPAVARDEKVVVRVVMGAVTIETAGRALSDARVGEVIRVRGMGAGDPYPARVVGDGVVLVGGR